MTSFDVDLELLNMHYNCVGFAKRVIENISRRFPDNSQSVVGAMGFLYPQKLIVDESEENKKAIQLLAQHYEPLFDTSDLAVEYLTWKRFIVLNIGMHVSSAEFLYAIFNTHVSQMQDFPTIQKILKISLTLAPGSVDCERAFSLQNLIKTKLRNSLTVETLSNLIRCSKDGEEVMDFNWREHVDSFLASKRRRLATNQ
jgi:hypothetical protein